MKILLASLHYATRTPIGGQCWKMTNVNGVFDHYRMSARSVWNTAFWPDPAFRDSVFSSGSLTFRLSNQDRSPDSQSPMHFLEFFDRNRNGYRVWIAGFTTNRAW
jgi:hypothetical protein